MDLELQSAYKYFIEESGQKIEYQEFEKLVKNYMSKENLTSKDLENISGGANNKPVSAILAAALTVLSSNSYSTAVTVNDSVSTGDSIGVNVDNEKVLPEKDSSTMGSNNKSYINPNSNLKAHDRQIIDYFTSAKISKTQQKAFEITNAFEKKFCSKIHFSCDYRISSDRSTFVQDDKLTEVEKILDEGVKNGDMPIKSFTLGEIFKVKYGLRKIKGKKPVFEIVKGSDVLNLHKIASDESIVQVASQYNALESMSSEFSPVKWWFWDKTQGPLACLQSTAGAKHRESAYLLGKLPDTIQPLLQNCFVAKNIFMKKLRKPRPINITEKYKDVYCGGYLQLYKITDIEDLRYFAQYIKSRVMGLALNSQWVLCEGSERKQLQVFNAAPSFQSVSVDWNNDSDERIKLYKDICKTLVVAQYRALAQVAAIRASYTGKQAELHVYQVGQGAFYNPLETMPEALKAIYEEVQGFNVKVCLHSGYGSRARSWDVIADEAGLKLSWQK